jgi:hypothetical protein
LLVDTFDKTAAVLIRGAVTGPFTPLISAYNENVKL